MFTLIKILLFVIIILNLGLFLLCQIYRFDHDTSMRIYKYLYKKCFEVFFVIIRKGILHPVLVLKLVLTRAISLIFRILSELLYPSFVLTFYIAALVLFASYKLCSAFHINIFLSILLTLIFLFAMVMCSDAYAKILQPYINGIWKKSCWAYKFFDNISKASYEKLSGSIFTSKIDPAVYAQSRLDNYEEHMQEIDEKHQNRNSGKPSKEAIHKMSYLDVLYPNELAVFGFYMKDFTLEDLKLKKRELLKTHHTDNYQNANDITYHLEKAQEITSAYTVLANELQKEA